MKEQVPTSFSDLPAALTPKILSHVPQQQRLTQCALVCRAWAAAATLSTVHVESRVKDTSVPALECWLQQHAGQLRTLKLSAFVRPSSLYMRLSLSLGQFKQLQRLELERFELQLPGEQLGVSSGQQLSDAASGLSNEVSLPSLQHLQLKLVLLESTTSLLQVTGAPQLSSLVLSQVIFGDLDNICDTQSYHYTAATVQRVTAVVAAMLQRLPRLSVLELPFMPLSDAAVQQMAAMQGLRQVRLSHMRHAACDLQRLPSSVTKLRFSGRLLPQLQQLTGLLHLQLKYCRLSPTLLGTVTQLQTLHMMSCIPLPSGDPAGAGELLAVLSKLICLQDLELQSLRWDLTGVAPQRFAALTASSHLTRLVVQSEEAAPLSTGAVQHMFPAHRRQCLLKYVQFTQVPNSSAWCMDSADLASIVSCCPALQHLDITHTVQPGADLSGLLQLPDSCTSLLVGGAAFTDAATATVAQLTQLKHLSWRSSPGFTDVGLEQLTALNLYRLAVWGCNTSMQEVELECDPDKGSVSEQLAALCKRRERQQKRLERELRRLA